MLGNPVLRTAMQKEAIVTLVPILFDSLWLQNKATSFAASRLFWLKIVYMYNNLIIISDYILYRIIM